MLRSSVPCSADDRTSDPSSCGDRAERSSSAGATPSRRTTQFAELFSALISHRNTVENVVCTPATARAVASACAIARFLGTSSPNTMDTVVASSSASAKLSGSATPSGRPIAASTGRSRPAMAGSAR